MNFNQDNSFAANNQHESMEEAVFRSLKVMQAPIENQHVSVLPMNISSSVKLSMSLNPSNFPVFNGSAMSSFCRKVVGDWKSIQSELESAVLGRREVSFSWNHEGELQICGFNNNNYIELSLYFFRVSGVNADEEYVMDVLMNSNEREDSSALLCSLLSSKRMFDIRNNNNMMGWGNNMGDLEMEMDDEMLSMFREEINAASNSLRSGMLDCIEYGLKYSLEVLDVPNVEMEMLLPLVESVLISLQVVVHPLACKFLNRMSGMFALEYVGSQEDLPSEIVRMVEAMHMIAMNASSAVLCRREVMVGLQSLSGMGWWSKMVHVEDGMSEGGDVFVMDALLRIRRVL